MSVKFQTWLVALVLLTVSSVALAQDKIPELPGPLQTLEAQGAQIRYLGRQYGMDGWITIQRGKEQFFYSTPDGQGVVMGLLFSNDGKLVTARQLSAMDGEDVELLSALSEDAGKPQSFSRRLQDARPDANTPSERLYADAENSNWVVLGNPQAPAIYMFVNPHCPHCHDFINALRGPYLNTGKMQVRMILVGDTDEAIARAAYLLAAPDAEDRWYKFLDGDLSALPAKKGINEQGIQMNISMMLSWKFQATPMTVYRSGSGEVKIVQGPAKDIHALYQDLL